MLFLPECIFLQTQTKPTATIFFTSMVGTRDTVEGRLGFVGDSQHIASWNLLLIKRNHYTSPYPELDEIFSLSQFLLCHGLLTIYNL